MFEDDEPHVVIECPKLAKLAFAALRGTELDVLDNVCRVIFLFFVVE